MTKAPTPTEMSITQPRLNSHIFGGGGGVSPREHRFPHDLIHQLQKFFLIPIFIPGINGVLYYRGSGDVL